MWSTPSRAALLATVTDRSSLSLNFAGGSYKTTTANVRTNLVVNGNGAGASGATPPTGWGIDQPLAGISPSGWNVATNALGHSVAQFTISGTTNGTSQRMLIASNVNSAGARLPVTAGVAYSLGYDAQVTAGSYPYNIQATPLWYDSGGVFLSQGAGQIVTPGSTATRVRDTFTAPANATTVHVRFDFVGYLASTVALNFGFALGAVQWEQAPSATSYIPTGGASASVQTTSSTNLADIAPLTVTRASGGYVTDASGNMTWVAANTPRISNLGLLIEEARTNIIPYSIFAGTTGNNKYPTGWSGTGNQAAIITLNASASVQGVATETVSYRRVGASGFEGLEFPYTLPSTGNWTFSAWVRRPTGVVANDLSVYIANSTPSNKTIATAAQLNAQAPDVWVRWSTTINVTATGSSGVSFMSQASVSTVGSGWDLALPQVEQAPFALSYIPTTGSAATRAADVVKLAYAPGAAYGVVGKFSSASPNGNFPALLAVDDGTSSSNNAAIVFGSVGASTTYGALHVLSGGVNQANYATGNTAPDGTSLTIAARIAASNFGVSLNGGSAADLASGSVPVGPTTLWLGQNAAGGAFANGYIRQVVVYPYAPTDAELQYRSAGNF